MTVRTVGSYSEDLSFAQLVHSPSEYLSSRLVKLLDVDQYLPG